MQYAKVIITTHLLRMLMLASFKHRPDSCGCRLQLKVSCSLQVSFHFFNLLHYACEVQSFSLVSGTKNVSKTMAKNSFMKIILGYRPSLEQRVATCREWSPYRDCKLPQVLLHCKTYITEHGLFVSPPEIEVLCYHCVRNEKKKKSVLLSFCKN